MRISYFLILIIFFSANPWYVNAQQDSLSKLNNTKAVIDTVQMPPLKAGMVNNGKEILLDTLKPKKDSATVILAKSDSTSRAKHIPRKATLRSALIPGWGQAYNHQYWKIPIVYGALAVPAGIFVYNNTWYKRTKDAYNILVNGGDSTKINPQLQGLSAESMQYYRNIFRKDRDYCVLFFLLAWALNVADATVFAHLKDFDVSNDLSLHIQPDFNGKTSSLAVTLNFKPTGKKLLPASF